jgi:hypothetical protein
VCKKLDMCAVLLRAVLLCQHQRQPPGAGAGAAG